MVSSADRPPQTPQLVWDVGAETYTTLKFVVGSFELDSIIRTEDSILDSCYKTGK
jgi:hypothetical protein